MKASPESKSAINLRPPHLFRSLISGFNVVANHIHLIALPILLDLLLWFGPHVRMKNLVTPVVESMLESLRRSNPSDVQPMIDNLQQIWQVSLEHFNLLSVLSTFPLGVPSLMAGLLPIETPLGEPAIVEVSSFSWMVLGWLGLSLAGFIVGSFYLAMMARSSIENPAARETLRPRLLAWQTLQLLGLVLVAIAILLVVLIPALLISVFLALISLALAQVALLLILFSAIWFMAPMIFSPHGIYASGQNLFQAILNSTRVVRYSLPGVSLFLLMLILLYQGMGLLWRSAPATSWMALIGIFGHAFVSSALLAASFIYYRRGLAYAQSLRQRII